MTDPIVTTDEALRLVLRRVSFAPSCLALDWQWEARRVWLEDPGATLPEDRFCLGGWHVRTTFLRPDTATGEVGRGFGRWEFVAVGTSASGVAKTAWLLCELIVRHELHEAFLVDGVRIFDPHHTIDDLSMPTRAKAKARRSGEAASRRSLARAEATIAAQVARGGDAGERVACDALENAEAAGRLLAAVERAKGPASGKPGRKRAAGRAA